MDINIKEIIEQISQANEKIKNIDKSIFDYYLKEIFSQFDELISLQWSQNLDFSYGNNKFEIMEIFINNLNIHFGSSNEKFRFLLDPILENIGKKSYFIENADIKTFSRTKERVSHTSDIEPKFLEELLSDQKENEKYFYYESEQMKIFNSYDDYQNHMKIKFKALLPMIDGVLQWIKNIFNNFGEIFFINNFGSSVSVLINNDNIEIRDYLTAANIEEASMDYFVAKYKNNNNYVR